MGTGVDSFSPLSFGRKSFRGRSFAYILKVHLTPPEKVADSGHRKWTAESLVCDLCGLLPGVHLPPDPSVLAPLPMPLGLCRCER